MSPVLRRFLRRLLTFVAICCDFSAFYGESNSTLGGYAHRRRYARKRLSRIVVARTNMFGFGNASEASIVPPPVTARCEK